MSKATAAKPNIVIIGGLVFNDEPLIMLNKLNGNTWFIDINSLVAPFSLDGITLQLEQILQAKYSDPVIIIAYSSGGLLALKLAISRPSLVDKLILINSTPCFLAKDNWHGINLSDFSRLSNKLAKLTLEQFKNHFCGLAVYPQIYKSGELTKWQSRYCTKEAIANWFKIIFATDLRSELVQIFKPILYLYAQYDHLVSNSNRILSGQQYTLSNSSHAKLDCVGLIKQIEEFIT